MSRSGMVGRLIGLSLAMALPACAAGPSNLELLHQSTVLVEHAKGHGTGTIVGPNAVLTAYHVVQEAPLEVTFFAGQAAGGRVVWQNAMLDLALVEVEVPQGYPVPEWSCADLHAGQHLVSIGHPTQSRWVAVGGYLPNSEAFGDIGSGIIGFSDRPRDVRRAGVRYRRSGCRGDACDPRGAQLGERPLRPLSRTPGSA